MRHRCIENLHNWSNANEVSEALHSVPLDPLLRPTLRERLGPLPAELFPARPNGHQTEATRNLFELLLFVFVFFLFLFFLFLFLFLFVFVFLFVSLFYVFVFVFVFFCRLL